MIALARRELLGLLGGAIAASLGRARSFAATPDASSLARGFNLPDQAPLMPGRAPDRLTLKALRDLGFGHVRLPVLGEAVMPRFSGAPRIETTLSDLERALKALTDLGFAVSVDMHPGDEFGRLHHSDPEAGYAALLEGWRALASAIQRQDRGRIYAEMLNEPHVADSVWRPQAERLVTALRPLLPRTPFIVGPAPFQRVEALAAWRPLDDPGVIYAFHYYDPMAFTHQGLTWDASSPLSRLDGVPFPTSRDDPAMTRTLAALRARGEDALAEEIDASLDQPWDARAIMRQFEPLATWSRLHRVPVILNEFGVLKFKAAPAARLAWLRAVRRAAEHCGFAWAHWDYNDGFGLLGQDGRPDEGVIEALLGA
jgi:endoglucanase